jgi:methyltransferase-like protein
MTGLRFPPQVGEAVRRLAGDALRQEQFIDFLVNRTFRQTLLVHRGCAVDRTLDPRRVEAMWVATALRPENAKPNLTEGAVEKFVMPTGMFIGTPRAITKAALLALTQQRPAAMTMRGLVAAAHVKLHPLAAAQPSAQDFETIANDMLQGYAAGVIEFHAAPSAFTVDVGERPRASPLVRFQAQRGGRVSTLRHESIMVPDPIRALLALLDGTRTIDDLRRAVQSAGASALGKLPTGGGLEKALDDIARNALLMR